MATLATPTPRRQSSQSPSEINSHVTASAALEAVGARPRRVQRRPTKQASYELCNHAKAYLEGGQYATGYDFLHHLLAAGTSISTPAQPCIGFLAPPSYLAFASSLVVYPKTTTKTLSKEAKEGSDAALRYLQCVYSTMDAPAYPAIRHAFRFPEESSRRRGRNHRSAAGSMSPRGGDDVELLSGDAANAESLWTLAEDFWQLVGWAFNCAISHRKRWDRWKLWLAIMLDFLEADWESCARMTKDESDGAAILRESLVWHYIIADSSSVNRAVRRRIVKAILASASVESLKDFPEVWGDETEGPKRKKEAQRFGHVSFETGDMGGYDGDQVMQDAPDETDDGALEEHVRTAGEEGIDAVEELGGMDAVILRQRFLALLVRVTQGLPKDFTTTSDFFDTILEDFVRLPVATLETLLATSRLPGPLHVAFCANLLLPLTSGNIPNLLVSELSQRHLESSLLPLKGITQGFAANAKVSLIIEQIMMHMMRQDALTATDTLRTAMEAGIQLRQSVHGTGKGKRGNAEEELQGKIVLESCSERLLGILEVLELKEGKDPQPYDLKAPRSSFWSFGTSSPLSDAPGSETDEDE
ncbi:hypothetical protein ACEQ8H_005696 [Pleosporales sp. CAS-2024a]